MQTFKQLHLRIHLSLFLFIGAKEIKIEEKEFEVGKSVETMNAAYVNVLE